MARKQKIRFWVYVHCPTLITIEEGQTLCHSYGGPTEEGWHRSSKQWSFNGSVITEEWCEDGQDCDGGLTRHGVAECQISQRFVGYVDPDHEGVVYPEWKTVSSRQRDYSAEAMGY